MHVSIIRKDRVYVSHPVLKANYVTGERYRGLIDDSKTFDKVSCFKIRYPKHEQWCIAHYESGVGRTQCSLKERIDYHLYRNLPRLRKPAFRQYQKKKDLRYNDKLSEKISQIKNNGVVVLRIAKKAYPLYLF